MKNILKNSGVVYLVDDDESMRKSLISLLESNGYKVDSHENAERFLHHLANKALHPVACLILDIRMPGISGIELQEQLIKQGFKLPTTFITGHGEVKLAVQAIKQGAIDFIQKPFQEAALCSVVDKMLLKAYLTHEKI